jgi:hypothetical protein
LDPIAVTATIGICIYSYQSKKLLDTIEEIKEKSSKKNMLYFYIIDQNNIDRTRSFSEPEFYKSVIYNYVKWDSIKSPVEYKQQGLNALSKTYYMQAGDDLTLIQNWDEYAIDFISKNKNSILTGNSNVVLQNRNYFQIEAKRTPSKEFNKIRYIDRNFLFGLTEDFKKIDYPKYLKYNGEEESISIEMLNKNINMYNFPDEYLSLNQSSIEKEYIPFSANHNYNKFVNLYKNKIKEYFNLDIDPLPFEDNDVLYDPAQSQTDKIGGLRYINKIKELK